MAWTDSNRAVEMTSRSEDFGAAASSGASGAGHRGDHAATFADGSADAAHVRASGAADRMWQKVEEDLEQIERAPMEDCDDD